MGSSSIDIQEMVRNTRERLEADFSKLGTKIHRFPRGLRPGINERYIIPSFVSLGPYHHGSEQLLETEELKHAAATTCARSRATQLRMSTARSSPSPAKPAAATPMMRWRSSRTLNLRALHAKGHLSVGESAAMLPIQVVQGFLWMN
ncbi:uncharacterized protein LOC125527970 isoform X3 [Triticum urartu]|uniref:uncharacterized protein LOC125527970 isoform X3 n=1 Tax=Triticum urartu TaxID=4572 RepID=UPI002043D140|nr:uncharacterized protein LOC125527970 isoform X3 [Triticum urartu]